jgi:hypothetical protein
MAENVALRRYILSIFRDAFLVHSQGYTILSGAFRVHSTYIQLQHREYSIFFGIFILEYTIFKEELWNIQ